MRAQDIIWTDKMRAVLRDDAQVLFLGGATGCSKSLVAGHKFMDWLNEMPAERTQFYIIFKDRGTGVRNFLHNNASFYNMFPHLRDEYKAYKEGGLQFVWHGLHGPKVVYLLGADDRTAWSKVLGSNPDGMWLEELSELHIDLVRECMGRTISRRCRLIATTNGGLPDQEFYKEFLNHAVVQFRETVPQVELDDMLEDKPYYHYYHFNLLDDSPHLSEEDKQKLLDLYPPGSFYYNSKILGVRGYVEGAAYADKMIDEIHIRDYDDINFTHLQEMIVGVDVGASRDLEDKSKSATIATLVGWSRGYQRAIVIERWAVAAESHDQIIDEIEAKLFPYWVKYMHLLRKIRIDSAEPILINTWRTKTKFATLHIGGAVKYIKDEITLVTRCAMKQQLIYNERLLWSSRALDNYYAHKRIMIDEDGAELDNATQDNDDADSLTYCITEYWYQILRQERRR